MLYVQLDIYSPVPMVGRKGAMEVRLLLRSSFSVSEDGAAGVHVERQRQKGAACA